MSKRQQHNFQFNFYGSVGQNIARVERMEVHFDKDMTMQVGSVGECSLAAEQKANAKDEADTAAELPAELRTAEARALLTKAVAAGWLDAAWQPTGSSTEAALLAMRLAELLDIKAVWKVFGQLWHRNSESLRAKYNLGMEQERSRDFLGQLRKVLR